MEMFVCRDNFLTRCMKWKKRQICGVFYTLVSQMDLPTSWLAYYARLFKEKSDDIEEPNTLSLNEILNAEFGRGKNCLDSDSGFT